MGNAQELCVQYAHVEYAGLICSGDSVGQRSLAGSTTISQCLLGGCVSPYHTFSTVRVYISSTFAWTDKASGLPRLDQIPSRQTADNAWGPANPHAPSEELEKSGRFSQTRHACHLVWGSRHRNHIGPAAIEDPVRQHYLILLRTRGSSHNLTSGAVWNSLHARLSGRPSTCSARVSASPATLFFSWSPILKHVSAR